MLESAEIAVKNREEKFKKQSDSLDMFFEEYDDELAELDDLIKKLKSVVADYNGYDFSQEFKDLIVTEVGGYE